MAIIGSIQSVQDHATELRRRNDIGHDQHWPAHAQQDDAGIDEIVAPGIPRCDDDEIRRSSLPRDNLVRQLERGAPFDLSQMLALSRNLLPISSKRACTALQSCSVAS